MGSERIEVGIADGVAHVALARPDKFNAMDQEMFAAIGDAFRALGRDSAVRAILLAGQGRHFTAGLDLDYASRQFPPSQDPGRAAEARLRHIEWLQDAFSAVEDARPPVVAAIQGGCIGAGVDLASACDLRIAAQDAFFQVAEVDVAITADLGTLQRLGHLIPQGILRELTYTGRRMGAEEAARFGLVNRVEADAADALAAGLELARTIAAKSPLAVAGAKRSLNYSRGRPVEEGLRDVATWNAATLVSADLGEAIRARLGKTEPGFGPLAD
ncbi:crotonase/enoyl-CoA hydratase family protein [Sphingosinicella sp. LHD-64]|uniref:crotonase/enoyl-CoA hydratase family protein n=1 Tax=Sphingosinicella sp. LHD-64 TaxID=3072139 RepID=UPI00280F0B1D|nr:crotonase/enoyl-CoA hydratase family protein [Sphingosinicella sp. LHD-64]MDQ8756879.1 crotonase/enoyl-CoA hydratase family protein [Sphingosinicella sp. LHD-64]